MNFFSSFSFCYRYLIRRSKISTLILIFSFIIFLATFVSILYNFNKNIEFESNRDPKIDFSVQNDQILDENPSTVSLKSILVAAIHFSIEGGKKVKEIKQSSKLQMKLKGKTREGANDVVTQGDFASHLVMYFGLQNLFPNIKVISEEHSEDEENLKKMNVNTSELPDLDEINEILATDEIWASADVTVWIDPLDATQEYTEDLLEYVTTMVCVAVRGVPLIGVIHCPFSGKTYWGAVGHGTSSSVQELSSNRIPNPFYKIIISRSHAGKVKNVLSSTIPSSNFELIKAGGAGYKVLKVIQGKADAYLHITAIKKWDICAGNAILNSIGGTLTKIDGERINYTPASGPLNDQGVLAYLTRNTEYIEKLQEINLNDTPIAKS